MKRVDEGKNRKCAYCGEIMSVQRERLQDIVLYDNRYYHKDHFLLMCQEKLAAPRTQKSKWQSANDDIEKYVKEAVVKISDYLDKDELYQFILQSYDMTVVPSTIFHKLAAIYDGSHKGMGVSIPAADLLDMWKRKLGYLNSIHAKRKSRDKELDLSARVNYDLSVLINKYDDYLKWKEKQLILESNSANHNNMILKDIDLQKLGKHNNPVVKEEDDVDDLLDEIFG